MELKFEELDSSIKKILLEGRMDIAGAEQIDLKFTALTATEKGLVLVDLSGVDFIASIGIRTLLSNAKAVSLKGGKMVICCPPGNVAKVLDTMDINSIVPVFETEKEALSELQAV